MMRKMHDDDEDHDDDDEDEDADDDDDAYIKFDDYSYVHLVMFIIFLSPEIKRH